MTYFDRLRRGEVSDHERIVSSISMIPAEDGNFKSALERADRAMIEEALTKIAGKPGHKVREQALNRQLRKLLKTEDTMKKQQPASDAQVAAANDIYKVAQEEANQKLQALEAQVDDIRQESFAQGVVRSMEAVSAYTELMKYVSLFRIKQHKEYREGGLTWDGFCDSLGLERRTVDRILEDISPLMSDFSDKVHMISNIPFNKIRHLGRQISGQLSEIQNGALVYGDETIPITPENADDIQAVIEKIETARQEALKEVSAKDKVLKDKEKMINKYAKQLTKLEAEAAAKELTAEEDAFLQRMENLRASFDGYLLKADPATVMTEFFDLGDITPRMRAALISTLGYMKMQVLAAYDTAVTDYGDPAMTPELMAGFDQWQVDPPKA